MDITNNSSKWLNTGITTVPSSKEVVDMPLVSAYSQAFLETITEEGSEFEASEDGSMSLETCADSLNTDYIADDVFLENQSVNMNQHMIGDADCPVDQIDTLDISLSCNGPLGVDRLLWGYKSAKCDASVLRERCNHQDCSETMLPKSDILILSDEQYDADDYLGSDKNSKLLESPNNSVSSVKEVSPSANPSLAWTAEDYSEELLVLAPDNETNKLCWKLENTSKRNGKTKNVEETPRNNTIDTELPTAIYEHPEISQVDNARSILESNGQGAFALTNNRGAQYSTRTSNTVPYHSSIGIMNPAYSCTPNPLNTISQNYGGTRQWNMQAEKPESKENVGSTPAWKIHSQQSLLTSRKTEHHIRPRSQNPDFPVVQPHSQRFYSMLQDLPFSQRPPPLPRAAISSHMSPFFSSTNPGPVCSRNDNFAYPFRSHPAVSIGSSLQNPKEPFTQTNGTGYNNGRVWETMVPNSGQPKSGIGGVNFNGLGVSKTANVGKTDLSDQYYSLLDFNRVNAVQTTAKCTASMGNYSRHNNAFCEKFGNGRSEIRYTDVNTRCPTNYSSPCKPEHGNDNPHNGTCFSEPKFQSPMWVANSTPRSHVSTGSNEQYEVTKAFPRSKWMDRDGGSYKQSSNPPDNLRQMHRSPAVLGVSELLSKTDEELNEFMQGTKLPSNKTSPQVSENTLNQTASIPTDHSPARRRFYYINQEQFKTSQSDSIGTDSASDQVERRSFYDYGDDDDEEIDVDAENVFPSADIFGLTRTSSAIYRPPQKRTGNLTALQDRSHLTNMPYETASSILDQIAKMDMDNSQFVWSDTCHPPHSYTEVSSIQNSSALFDRCDLPYIDSDAFAGEEWGFLDSPRKAFLYRPKKASLDEITLTSKHSSHRTSWGSASNLNRLDRDITTLASEAETGRSGRSKGKRVRINSRRDFHSYDSSTETKGSSKFRKLTAPLLQRLCGCVKSSRIYKKSSH